MDLTIMIIGKAVTGYLASKPGRCFLFAVAGLGPAVLAGSYLLMGILPALFIPQKIYDCQSK